jgi:hypothetical protein
MRFRIECMPAFDYGRATHRVNIEGHGATFEGPNLRVGLASDVPLTADRGGAVGEFVLSEGSCAAFVLRGIDQGSSCGAAPSHAEVQELFERSVGFWQGWLARCT